VGQSDLPPEIGNAEILAERTLGSLGQVLVARVPAEKLAGPPEAATGADSRRPAFSTVALRLVAADAEHGDEAVALLREDATALRAIDHPNLVRVLGLVRRGREEFAAVELPEGDDLASLVARRQFPLERAASVAGDVARALGVLAAIGRPHRDFRLSCVFVAKDGLARVVPLAFPPEFRVEPKASKLSVYRGLPHYAAPELHAEGGGSPTEKSNIFAFGVAFFEMLTCQAPFRGGTPTRMLIDIRESAPPRPSAVAKDVPAELERICLRCLEKDPERRFPSFAAVEASLRIALETAPVARRAPSTRAMSVAPGPGTPAAESARRARMTRRQIAVAAAVSCVAALAVALAVLSGLRPLDEVPPPARLAEEVLTKALAHMKEGEYEKAWRLLEAHRAVREVSPSAYDDLHRRAAGAHWIERAERAEEARRWSEAAQALDQALGFHAPEGREGLLLRRDRCAFRASLARADAAELSGDWKEARDSLQEALALAEKIALGAEETAALERRAERARSAALAAEARRAGDEGAERRFLLQAALTSFEGDKSAFQAASRAATEALMKRLEELGLGPAAADSRLVLARKALASGDANAAEALAKEAGALWPPAPGVEDLLAYVADWKSCEARGMVLVSARPSEESWERVGRAQAFCIDRYEFPGRAGEMPQTLVSAVEAASLCAARGERLCRLAEWQLACGGRESLAYPYGNEYRVGICMTNGASSVPAGSLQECRSPFGVMDMSGNVAEWTSESVGAHVLVAGGDWSSGAALSRCTSVTPFNPGLTSTRVGFRCCGRAGQARAAPSP